MVELAGKKSKIGQSPKFNQEDFMRYKYPAELFSDQDTQNVIEVDMDGEAITYQGETPIINGTTELMVNYYIFRTSQNFQDRETECLLPPYGSNLPAVIRFNQRLRQAIGELLEQFGYKLVIRVNENQIEFQKELDNSVITSFSYELLSETLQKIIFINAIIESNRNAIICLEEPDSGTFPVFAKYIAEKIALDQNNNQYFITTHNPYFLLPLLEHTRDVEVFLTQLDNTQTILRRLDADRIMEKDADTFFNLEALIAED